MPVEIVKQGRLPKKNLVGLRFGSLEVLEFVGRDKSGGAHYELRCDCGNLIRASAGNINNGDYTSCGCRKRLNPTKKHGLRYSREWSIWNSMKNRCLNPKRTNFKWYGGRGIKVCERWRKSFALFYADMGPCPSPKHSIDRIDVNGHYDPGNCRWLPLSQQNSNKRNNKHQAHSSTQQKIYLLFVAS